MALIFCVLGPDCAKPVKEKKQKAMLAMSLYFIRLRVEKVKNKLGKKLVECRKSQVQSVASS